MKYVPNGTPLTEYEREILTILAEEAAEIVQAATKLLRFGKENRPNGGEVNTIVLAREVGDLNHMVFRCLDVGLIDMKSIDEGRRRKEDRLRIYLQATPP